MNKKSAVKNVIFFLFLMIFLIHCTVDENSYSTEFFTRGAGITNDGHIVFVDYFFSIECFFEASVRSISLKRNYSHLMEAHINYFLREFIVEYVSQFSVSDIYFSQAELYNGFMAYASGELNDIIEGIDGLTSVRITKLEILENPETMANRLRRLE